MCIVVATAMVLSIAFSGIALAAQINFNVVVKDGSARVQSSLRSTSNTTLPYDHTKYNYNAIAVHGSAVQLIHTEDFDANNLESESSVLYLPANNLKVMFVDENVQRAKVAEGADNASLCYNAQAGSKVNSNALNYESAAITTDSNVEYAMKAVGVGRISMATTERLQQGNTTGEWVSSFQRNGMAVRGGLFNVSGSFSSVIPEAPPAAEAPENLLCPFTAKKP